MNYPHSSDKLVIEKAQTDYELAKQAYKEALQEYNKWEHKKLTNPERVRRGIKDKAANALLVKLNQIGSLTETIEAVEICQRAGWRCCYRAGHIPGVDRPFR